MQLKQLQCYIRNIARCIGILDLLSVRRQDNQWNTLILCETICTSQLSINYKNFQQLSDIQTRTEKYTSPTKTILLTMSPSTRKLSGSSGNITISTEAKTNYTLLSPSVSKSDLENSLQELYDRSQQIFRLHK